MANSNYNIIGIIALLGSILMIVGVFLAWGSFEIPAISKVYEISGWELATFESDGSFAGEIKAEILGAVKYAYVPLVTLALGVLCLIGNIIPAAKNGNGKFLTILSLLFAIVTVIMAIMYYTDVTSITSAGSYTIVKTGVGLGFWLSLAGSLVVAIGDVLSVAKNQ